MNAMAIDPEDTVLTCGAIDPADLKALFARYGLIIQWIPDRQPIPGSYWGEREAGLIGDTLLIRRDTPLHSAFHEACHWICMDQQRRQNLHTDAGGSDLEENAVNYLQILLADQLPGFGRERMLQDMDAWGYSFRLGSAGAWFANDAEDAQAFLIDQGLIQPPHRLRFQMRR